MTTSVVTTPSRHDRAQVHRKREDRKPVESTKFYVLNTDSIVIAGESVGISELSIDVSKAISEDVSYRLREVIFNCNVLLRHCKSKKLTTDAVDAVFKTCCIPPVHGHCAIEPLAFVAIVPPLSAVEDVEVDLPQFASSTEQYVQPRDVSLHGEWVHPDSSGAETNPAAVRKDEGSCGAEKLSATKQEDVPSEKLAASTTHMPSFLVTYFRHFAKVILSDSVKLLQVVLEDLRRNRKLAPVVPCFLNLVAFSLQKLPRATPTCLRLLSVVEALAWNAHVHPEGSTSVSRLVSVLLLCAVEVRPPNPDDHDFRMKAGHMLAKVMDGWCRSETKLHADVVQKLGSVVVSGGSLRSQYGALVSLYALGPDALDQGLWPHLPKLLAALEPQLAAPGPDALQLHRALLMAAELLYHQEWRWRGDPAKSVCLALHQLLYDHFGDVLCVAKAHGLPHKVAEESCVATTSPDVPVFSLAKHPVTNVFELDYMNWTAIAPMPSNLATLLRTSGTYVTSRKEKQSSARHLTIATAFTPPLQKSRVLEAIHFSFAGGNPVPAGGLRKRRPGPLQTRFLHHSTYYEHSCRLGCIGKLGNKPRRRAVASILAVL